MDLDPLKGYLKGIDAIAAVPFSLPALWPKWPPGRESPQSLEDIGMFSLIEYRVIVAGMLVTIAELEDASQKIDNILAGRISAYNHLELAAYRDSFKESVERLATSLVEFKKRAVADKIELVKSVNAVRREYRLQPRHPKPAGVSFHKSPEPVYCGGCGLLADTFCECGFHSPEKGAA